MTLGNPKEFVVSKCSCTLETNTSVPCEVQKITPADLQGGLGWKWLFPFPLQALYKSSDVGPSKRNRFDSTPNNVTVYDRHNMRGAISSFNNCAGEIVQIS